MTDQGWMVDDGTCDECLTGECWDCADPLPFDTGDRAALVCCCNEGYEISWRPYDDEEASTP